MLGHLFGAGGIAAGIALGAWSNAFSLIRRRCGDVRIFASTPRRGGGCRASSAAALAMGGLLWLAAAFVPAARPAAHGLVQAALLSLLIAAGIAIYGLFLRLFGVTGWREAVKRDPAKPRRLATCAARRRVANDGAKAGIAREAEPWHSLNGFFRASSRPAICISAIISARSSTS